MRSLFLKIFLYFWLAMTLIGAIGILIALNSDPNAMLNFRQEQLSAAGQTLIDSYRTEGVKALHDQHRRARDENLPRMLLLSRDGKNLLPGRTLPRHLEQLASRAIDQGGPVTDRGPRGAWVVMPVDNYLLAAELPRRSRLEHLLNPRRLGIRLLIAFLVAGGVCWMLARSLTAPLRRLREATREIAAGQLQTRVAPELRKWGGETGDLAIDFDHMTERVATLLNNQQRLLRDISHELRSPLARLNVALELARRQTAELAIAPLNRIELEAERLNIMIGQLLTLTQLESGQGIGRTEPVALDILLGEIVADAAFEGQHLTLDCKAEPATVNGSLELLRQALENIVRNALHHAPAGSEVTVQLKVRQTDIHISIRDQGPGVPPAALGRLFDPFYRVEEDRARRSGGSGIGLAITERAVKLHGGSVTAENIPGGGFEVVVLLPRA
ncbi:MAG: HAMP domain-containing protein [Desulfuromonadaceae bacterium]|nr:HAMP domain-containing protein [Desulfuromonadaceae bacterium]